MPSLHVFRFHQLIQIDLLRPRQPFVEVHRVPGIVRFLGDRSAAAGLRLESC
jgi:hypothetical protein